MYLGLVRVAMIRPCIEESSGMVGHVPLDAIGKCGGCETFKGAGINRRTLITTPRPQISPYRCRINKGLG